MTNIFDESNVISNNWVKFAKEGDFISGTLISSKKVDNKMPGKEGTKQDVYEILAESGTTHGVDDKKVIIEPGTTINPDEVWLVGGHYTIEGPMSRVKVGQKVAIRFEESKPSATKGFAPMKIFKAYTSGEMNQAWLDSQPFEVPLA